MIATLAAITALLSVLLGAVCWTLYAVLRQNGRILTRLDAIEAAVAAPREAEAEGASPDRSLARSRINRAGLAPGTLAPDFRLPTLDGDDATLSQHAGRWLLLVFTDPDCAPCVALLPRLARAARTTQADVLLVSRGSAEANREKLAAAGVRFRVALQQQWEVSRLYAKFATPIGYLIDPHGRIASPVAAGAAAILALLDNDNHAHDRRADSPRPSVH
jgi:peroxiredoxin